MAKINVIKFLKPIANSKGEYFATVGKSKVLYYSVLEIMEQLDPEQFLLIHRGVETVSKAEYAGNDYEVAFISDTVASIEGAPFTECPKLRYIAVDPDNEYYKSINGTLYNKLETVLIQYAIKNTETLVIPRSITTIENDAFAGCSNLKAVYYQGTATDWKDISIGVNNEVLNENTIYYYSETKPNETDTGHYWRYVNGIPTAWLPGAEFVWSTEGDNTHSTAVYATCYAKVVINNIETRIYPTEYSTDGPENIDEIPCSETTRVIRIAKFATNEYFTARIESKVFVVNGEYHESIDEEETITPTCTDPGEMTYTCQTCGYSYSEEIDALGHNEVDGLRQEPTCTTNGWVDIDCERCGSWIRQKIIPALGHIEIESITSEADCTNNGSKRISCERCFEVIREEAIPATGHNFELDEDDGISVCTNCGNECSHANIDYSTSCTCPDCGMTVHTIVGGSTSRATCTSPAYVYYGFCEYCDHDEGGKYVGSPLGHNFVNGVCTRCGDYECSHDNMDGCECPDCGGVYHVFKNGKCNICGEPEPA